MSQGRSKHLGLRVSTWLVLLFLHFPIAIVALYAFTTEASAFTFPPPGLTFDWFGVAWDNEVSWWLDKNMVIKGQFSFIFPTGGAVEQITEGLSNRKTVTSDAGAFTTIPGVATNDTAIRLALELLWNF